MTGTSNPVHFNVHGQAALSSDQLQELILQGRNIEYLHVLGGDEDIELFKKFQSDLLPRPLTLLEPSPDDMSEDEFHRQASGTWTIPQKYRDLDVLGHLLLKCKSEEETARVKMEYQLFEERDMIMPLRLFVFLVDHMRQSGSVWGVGRGSAVSSYILYLIGIHRVDSLKYGLDIKEFLR